MYMQSRWGTPPVRWKIGNMLQHCCSGLDTESVCYRFMRHQSQVGTVYLQKCWESKAE